MRAIPLVFALILSLAPLTTHAAFDFVRIIPVECRCESVSVEGGGTSPSAPAYGCVLQTIQNVVRVAIALGFVIFTLALVYAGFVWMTSGGNPGRLQQGKNLLLNTFIGLFIMLAAWLIVDFVMKTLYDQNEGFGPWNNILAGNASERCLQARQPRAITTGTLDIISEPPGGSDVADPITGTTGCPSCVSLSQSGFICKSSSSCTIDSTVLPRLIRLKDGFSGSWRVTEAYPPTARHSNQCHYTGTCIDAGFTGGTTYTAQNIAAFARAARTAGLRPVFETQSCSLRDAARQAGVTAYCSSDGGYGHITGNHFSVYSN